MLYISNTESLLAYYKPIINYFLKATVHPYNIIFSLLNRFFKI